MTSQATLAGQAGENAVSSIDAIVIQQADNHNNRPVVGGIGLSERWQRGLTGHGAAVRTVSNEQVAANLKTATRTSVLALGDWVLESLGHEAVTEASAGCAEDEILIFTAPGRVNAPALCIGSKAANQLAHSSGWNPTRDWDALLGTAGAEGIPVRSIPLADSYWEKVDDDASARRATWGLLQRLQFRPGGLIAQYINRPISIRLSRHLVNTSVTPNQTTMFAFLLGLVGIALLFQPGQTALLIGALLLQANSVIDGVDGELARLRLTTSEFGAYLDSVCDEVLNALLFVAIGYRLAHFGGWLNGLPYLQLGIFAGTTAFIYSLVHWHCKSKHGLGFYWWFEAYKPRKQVQRSNSPFALFKKLFWKESYLFLFLVLSIIHAHEALLWIALPAAGLVWILFFVHIVIKRARW